VGSYSTPHNAYINYENVVRQVLEAKVHLTLPEFQKSLDLQKVSIFNHSALLKIGPVKHEYFTLKHYDAMMMVLANLKIQFEKDSSRAAGRL